MTQDEIIEMASKAGYPLVEYEGKPYVPPMLAILLKTVTEAEREACAKVADEYAQQVLEHNFSKLIAHNIRARGEQA